MREKPLIGPPGTEVWIPITEPQQLLNAPTHALNLVLNYWIKLKVQLIFYFFLNQKQNSITIKKNYRLFWHHSAGCTSNTTYFQSSWIGDDYQSKSQCHDTRSWFTWKCGPLRILESSAALSLCSARPLMSDRMSLTSSTLLFRTASSFTSSSLSWACRKGQTSHYKQNVPSPHIIFKTVNYIALHCSLFRWKHHWHSEA